MIVKSVGDWKRPSDARLRAGVEAEKQMAFYLHRAFVADERLFVLNDLRLWDAEQPEHDGGPGVCQMDHLVLHRWGAFIIESKSVTDEVAVRDDGASGDEWTRRVQGRERGFPSPIQQARRQGEFLRVFLQRHREALLGKMPTGVRTLSKIVHGSDQRGFRNMPIQIVVAISDYGKIRRVNGWKEPAKPFQAFVSKADLVAEKINEEFGRHRAASRPLSEMKGRYGLWNMKPEEVGAVAEFLKEQHRPRSGEPRSAAGRTPVPESNEPAPVLTPPPAAREAKTLAQAGPACKRCGGTDLAAKWGKFGYFWRCTGCGTNTAMPTVCGTCGTEGRRGQVVRIRKDGPNYFRKCEKCGSEENIWAE